MRKEGEERGEGMRERSHREREGEDRGREAERGRGVIVFKSGSKQGSMCGSVLLGPAFHEQSAHMHGVVAAILHWAHSTSCIFHTFFLC